MIALIYQNQDIGDLAVANLLANRKDVAKGYWPVDLENVWRLQMLVWGRFVAWVKVKSPMQAIKTNVF